MSKKYEETQKWVQTQLSKGTDKKELLRQLCSHNIEGARHPLNGKEVSGLVLLILDFKGEKKSTAGSNKGGKGKVIVPREHRGAPAWKVKKWQAEFEKGKAAKVQEEELEILLQHEEEMRASKVPERGLPMPIEED